MGIGSKIQPFLIFVGLDKVHRRVNKMIGNEEAALGGDGT